jgi:hypothetical protein
MSSFVPSVPVITDDDVNSAKLKELDDEDITKIIETTGEFLKKTDEINAVITKTEEELGMVLRSGYRLPVPTKKRKGKRRFNEMMGGMKGGEGCDRQTLVKICLLLCSVLTGTAGSFYMVNPMLTAQVFTSLGISVSQTMNGILSAINASLNFGSTKFVEVLWEVLKGGLFGVGLNTAVGTITKEQSALQAIINRICEYFKTAKTTPDTTPDLDLKKENEKLKSDIAELTEKFNQAVQAGGPPTTPVASADAGKADADKAGGRGRRSRGRRSRGRMSRRTKSRRAKSRRTKRAHSRR